MDKRLDDFLLGLVAFLGSLCRNVYRPCIERPYHSAVYCWGPVGTNTCYHHLFLCLWCSGNRRRTKGHCSTLCTSDRNGNIRNVLTLSIYYDIVRCDDVRHCDFLHHLCRFRNLCTWNV